MPKSDRYGRWLLLTIPFVGAFAVLLLLLKGLDAPLPTPAPPTPTPDPAQEVVARVGEQRITFADWAVAFYLDALMSRLSGQPAPAANETLDRLVNDVIILAAAEEEGIAASKADVEARIALLEATWNLTDEHVAAELAALSLTRELWSNAIARLLAVERYLNEVVWASVTAEGQANALGDWLQTHRAQTSIEVATRGLQPLLPTPMPVPSATPLTVSPVSAATALPAITPTATPLAASYLATPSPPPSPTSTPTATSAPGSPLPTPAASPLATLGAGTVEPPMPSAPPVASQPAPDFALTDANGQTIGLSDYRDQRKVIIVFFRTTG